MKRIFITLAFLIFFGIGVSSLHAQTQKFNFSYSSIEFAKAVRLPDPFSTEEREDPPIKEEITLDYKDIQQQSIGYEWLFSDSHNFKKLSYPVKMSCEIYDSHPDLRISGNGIYDSEGNLKRIILLRRENELNTLRVGNLEISGYNGIFSIEYGTEGKSIQDKIFRALYAYDYTHNKYGIKNNLNANTKYAIENLVGIQSKDEEIEKIAYEYKAARELKYIYGKGPRAAEFNVLWNRVSKNYPIIKAHREKMNNDIAQRWYMQVVSDHKERIYVCSKISRISDLCFNVEYTDGSTNKVILKATVEFYQVPIKKYSVESFQIFQNPQRYEWRVKDAQFIE
ncbi:hypothetical protein I6E23_08710 [Prevotella brevis]|nr:hypothetical protein [Xylanibacter brevis]